MRIVAALGGNALLRRGEPADAAVQLHNVAAAVGGLAALADDHELVVTHGNGPQVGLLALESAADPALARPYPLDTLVAETQGMIGYWLARELRTARPDREIVALVTQTVVDPADPAFAAPDKFVGPGYDRTLAEQLARAHGWTVRPDGPAWRRVVPSPEPLDVVELGVIRRLVRDGVLVIAAGGGGVPVARTPPGALRGVEAVVDKDLVAALLAAVLQADLLLLLTDVPCVYADFGTPGARPVARATPRSLAGSGSPAGGFPAGSMGPKVRAACRFVAGAPGRRAVIGSLQDAPALAAGTSGTQITTD